MSIYTIEDLFAHEAPSPAQRIEHAMSELRWAISKEYVVHTSDPLEEFPYVTSDIGADLVDRAEDMLSVQNVPRPKGEPVNPFTEMDIDEGVRLWCLLCALVQPVPIEPGEENEDANRLVDQAVSGRLHVAADALTAELTNGGLAGA